MLAPLLLLSLAVPPSVDADNGTYLFHACQAYVRLLDAPPTTTTESKFEDVTLANYCSGYMKGTLDVLVPSGLLCPTDTTTVRTIARVYVRYMESNPKLMDDPEYKGFLSSVVDAYPCSFQKK
jgi:hypothetical protein